MTGSLQGGGAERVLSEMANYWVNKGFYVTFATWSGPEVADFYSLDERVSRRWMDVPARQSRLSRISVNLRRVFRLRSMLRAVNPDTVLSFITTSNVLTIAAATALRVRVVVSERIEPAADVTVSPGWQMLRRFFYRRADCVVAQSSAAARWIERYCRAEPAILPNPLRDLPQMDVAREPLVVAVGRLDRQKGFDLLLRAFAALVERFPDWRLALVGDGRERDALRKQRDELDLHDRVEFAGHVSDVEAWMARAGLIVQPSRFEGFPNVLLESMAMGAPVVSADCPSGPSEIIDDGVNGRLVAVEDVPGLTRVMAELMADEEQRQSLGREARKVRDRFRRETVMSEWEQHVFPAGRQ